MHFLAAAALTSSAICAWDVYLLKRHHDAHKTKVIPSAFAGSVTQEAFEATQKYSLSKIMFSMVSRVVQTVESVNFLRFLPKVWNGVHHLLQSYGPSVAATYFKQGGGAKGGFLHALSFYLATDMASTILGIPMQYYSTFVIEAKHGFNKTTRQEFVKDILKGFALRAVLIHPFTVGLINFVVNRFGPAFPVYMFAGGVAFITAATFLIPVVVMPLFNKFTPLPDGSLRREVEALAAKISFPLTKVFEVDGSRRSAHSNAYFYGFFNNQRIVLYDTLLKQMSEKEILAVLCHEFGHWYHGHTKLMFLIGLAELAAICLGVKLVLFNPALHEAVGFANGEVGPALGLNLYFIFHEPLSLVLGYLVSMLSRRFEFQADAFAVKMGYGESLIRALHIMQEENKASITPDWLYAALHYSHPPLVVRLGRLEEEIRAKANEEEASKAKVE